MSYRESDFDGTMLLPTKARSCVGMPTVCDSCRESITDEFFVGAIRQGVRNMKFHQACLEGLQEPTK
jgi:hypothetical protein